MTSIRAAKEYFESEEKILNKAEQLVTLMNQSKHIIFFTGAGISTAAGIADFRGPQGLWTLQEQKKKSTMKTTPMTRACPTTTHMAIMELVRQDICKYLVSQNLDGLHRKSGVAPDKISELHGNRNVEFCEKCGKEYLRDFRARTAMFVHDHYTGRTCSNPKCLGKLLDNIINFDEQLPAKALELAYEHAAKADLCIALGSSLTVSPANEIPEIVAKNGGKLVIVNLQKTPLDDMASLRFFCRTDDLMTVIMDKLQLKIPKFVLTRRVKIGKDNKGIFHVQGVEVDGTPASFFPKVIIREASVHILKPEPFQVAAATFKKPTVDVMLFFFGHHGEPDFKITHNVSETTTYLLEYKFKKERKWIVTVEKTHPSFKNSY